MNRNILDCRIVSVVTISAGYGWAGGHFIPTDSGPLAYLFQITILLVLFILGTGYLGLSEEQKWKRHWSIRGLTIFSMLSFLVNVVNIIHGAMNEKSNSFGSHNSVADLIPIGIILAGTGLWLITLFYSTFTRKSKIHIRK
jgi:hypothetical protein